MKRKSKAPITLALPITFPAPKRLKVRPQAQSITAPTVPTVQATMPIHMMF